MRGKTICLSGICAAVLAIGFICGVPVPASSAVKPRSGLTAYSAPRKVEDKRGAARHEDKKIGKHHSKKDYPEWLKKQHKNPMPNGHKGRKERLRQPENRERFERKWESPANKKPSQPDHKKIAGK
jgi:hypothetical protein